MNESVLITTTKDLEHLIAQGLKRDAIGLDTEFVWERTYTPQLGLIQLALSNEECFLIDPLAIKDLSPLAELLTNPDIVKIFHDAPQDLIILNRAADCVTKNVFDTRVAAGFAGLAATISLANLLDELLDIQLAKTETRTNWLRRPLHEKQILYGLDDVRYLRAARVLLLGHILSTKELSWLNEELAQLDNPVFYSGPDKNKRYSKIKGAGALSRQQLAILKELTLWREQEAEKRDLPRQHIIQDQVLLKIARTLPTTSEAMAHCGSVSDKTISRYFDELIKVINRGSETPKIECPPVIRRTNLNKTEKEVYRKLTNLITLKSDIHAIDPFLVGNRTELKQIIKTLGNNKGNYNTIRQGSGWRHNFIAEIIGYLEDEKTNPDDQPETL